jgi:thioesterase domain-containing protein
VGLAETDPRWGLRDEAKPLLTTFIGALHQQMQRDLKFLRPTSGADLERELDGVVDALLSDSLDRDSTILMDWLSGGGHLREDAPRGMLTEYLRRVTTHLRLLPHADPCPVINVPLHIWQASGGLMGEGFRWEALTDKAITLRTVPGNHFDVIGPRHGQSLARELAQLLS